MPCVSSSCVINNKFNNFNTKFRIIGQQNYIVIVFVLLKSLFDGVFLFKQYLVAKEK